MPVYEVWCHNCDVTFPPEARQCVHCGARLNRERPARWRRGRGGSELAVPFADVSQSDRWGMDVLSPSDPAAAESRSSAPELETLQPGPAVEVEEAPVRRSLLRAGMTVVWMVLLAAGYAWRACSQ